MKDYQLLCVADAAAIVPFPKFLYTSHRGGHVNHIRHEGGNWYTIWVEVPERERKAINIPEYVRRQVAGTKPLYLRIDKPQAE